MKSTNLDQVYALDEDFLIQVENPEWIPEKRLLFAILERAARDYLGNQSLEAQESGEWLNDDEGDTLTPFSYGWICEELEISPKEFRRRIVKAFEARKPSAVALSPNSLMAMALAA